MKLHGGHTLAHSSGFVVAVPSSACQMFTLCDHDKQVRIQTSAVLVDYVAMFSLDLRYLTDAVMEQCVLPLLQNMYHLSLTSRK